MIKLVIFDLDGTLINTITDIGNACNHALKSCGFPEKDASEYNALVGRGIYNMFRDAVPEGEATEDTVNRMASFFIPYYDLHKCDFTLPYDGIPELLEALASGGIRFAVASNKYQDGTEKLVGHFFGQYTFDKILGQRDGQPVKPDPAIVMQAMEAAGVSKEEVVYLGDSNVDMQTGINAGVKTIGALWGFRTKAELEAYHPWKLAERPEDVIEMILSENRV